MSTSLLPAAATTQVVVQTFQKESKCVEIRLSTVAEQLLGTAAPGGADAVNRLHSASGESDDHRALITWRGPTGNQACGTEAADPPADSRFGDSEMSADLAELQRSVSLQQGEKGYVHRSTASSASPHGHTASGRGASVSRSPFPPGPRRRHLGRRGFRSVWRSSPAACLRLDALPAHPPGVTSDGRRLLRCPRGHFSSAPIRFSNACSRPCALDAVTPEGRSHR
jgi:hypothetical protein